MAGDSAEPEEAAEACGFDPSKPNAARVYDYLLGGKDNFAADRDAAARLVEALPDAAHVAKANRSFLAAAVRYVAGQGVGQYVDIGAGLPTSPNVHQTARVAVPGARVAYVDNDPLVATHARALLATDDLVTVVNGTRASTRRSWPLPSWARSSTLPSRCACCSSACCTSWPPKRRTPPSPRSGSGWPRAAIW